MSAASPTNSPGANLHDQREPAGRGAGTRRVQIRLERICMTKGSPQGEAQGRVEYKFAWSEFEQPKAGPKGGTHGWVE